MSDETTIARLRADLAVTKAITKRLAREVGYLTERREFFAALARATRDEYDGLRAAIGQAVGERGASTHEDAVLQGEWLTSIAKDRARGQRAQAFVERLKADGVVIPSTAPVRVLDGNDDSERDEPESDECTCMVPDGWRGFMHTVGCPALAARRDGAIDRTAAGCATACTDVEQIDRPELEAIVICLRYERDDLRVQLDMANRHSVWASEISADLGTDQTDGCHGGAAELAVNDVLDDPRMGGEEWIAAKDVTLAMARAWPVWETGHETRTMDGGIRLSRYLEVWVDRAGWTWRPLRFPHQSADTGAIESRYMTHQHLARCEWDIRLEGQWVAATRHDWSPNSCRVPNPAQPQMWRPVGWPDVEAKPDEPKAASVELPDDLLRRIKAMERRQSSLDSLVPTVTQLGERLAKLEYAKVRQPCGRCSTLVHPSGISQGVCLGCHAEAEVSAEPEETPDPLLDGLVPVRADATHPGQWVTLPEDGGRWRRYAPEPREAADLPADHIALEAGLGLWYGRHIEAEAIVYVEPE